MIPDPVMEEYLRRLVDYTQDDSLERAQAAFRGLTPAQMQEQHGSSGKTRQQILDGYRESRARHMVAGAYLDALIEQSRRAA